MTEVRFGTGSNYWTLDTEQDEYHLERNFPSVRLETTSQAIHVAPINSALVIVDMQNFFLSEKLGRGDGGRELVAPTIDTIRAMRSAGSTIIWLNWGFDSAPPYDDSFLMDVE